MKSSEMFQQILYESIDVTTSPLFNIIRKSFLFNKSSISVDCLKMVKEIGTLRAFQTVFHLKKERKQQQGDIIIDKTI